jgi:hypothetical protein
MIPPQYQSRFEGDSGIDIATQEIDVVFASGEKRRIVLRIGAPFKKPDARGDMDWWIRSELEHLDSTEGPFVGCGSLDALLAAIRWITARLDRYHEALGCRYFWPGTEDEFDYRQILSGVLRKKDS